MTEYMKSDFGNPSSLHLLGINASVKLEKCRSEIADKLGCDKNEIYFTSCGSESNNTAIFGAVKANTIRCLTAWSNLKRTGLR